MTTNASDVSPDVVVDVDHHSDAFNLDELAEWAKLRTRCPVLSTLSHGPLAAS